MILPSSWKTTLLLRRLGLHDLVGQRSLLEKLFPQLCLVGGGEVLSSVACQRSACRVEGTDSGGDDLYKTMC